MNPLSARLQSLGVKLGARDLSPPRPRLSYPIEQVMQGRFLHTASGEAFVVETARPLDYRHGCCTLRTTSSLDIIAEYAGDLRLTESDPKAFAFLDTETTGLTTGTGTYAFLIGVGRCEGDTFHLAQFFMRDPSEEPALLTALSEFLRPCQALVTFNGKAFDAPLLNARYTTNGEASPLELFPHLDLLSLARRLWRDRLPSRSLGYLETHILGVSRTEEDVPSWLIPDLYFDYLRTGDARPLKDVFYHNAVDVLSMAALLNHTAGLLDDPLHDLPNHSAVHALDVLAIAKLYEALGRVETAVLLYERGLGHALPQDARSNAVRLLSFAEKRRGNLSAAVGLWSEAARDGQIYAHVELAKFYEHREQDYDKAAQWTEMAIRLLEAHGVPSQECDCWLAGLEHRLARLERKLAQRGKSAAVGAPTTPAATPEQP